MQRVKVWPVCDMTFRTKAALDLARKMYFIIEELYGDIYHLAGGDD